MGSQYQSQALDQEGASDKSKSFGGVHKSISRKSYNLVPEITLTQISPEKQIVIKDINQLFK